MFNKIGIVGPGLIGGSIGKFYKAKGKDVVCFGRNKDRLRIAKREGVCGDFSTDLSKAGGCGIVAVCTPVDVITQISKSVIPFMKKGAILIDTGSVKSEICRKVHPFAKRYGIEFVGCHPMAGSEKSGCINSRGDLFRGTNVLLTPVSGTGKGALKKVKKFWSDLGADCSVVRPDKHDEFAALTSHLPHVISFCFTEMFLSYLKKSKISPAFIAGSFKNMTRVSKSSPFSWNAIFKQNSPEINRHIKKFTGTLDNFKKNINDRRLLKKLNDIRNAYEGFENKTRKKNIR
ncbi:MAG: prephenate dehydrogenase [bacterium]